jgi:hypothetical protein
MTTWIILALCVVGVLNAKAGYRRILRDRRNYPYDWTPPAPSGIRIAAVEGPRKWQGWKPATRLALARATRFLF